MKPVKRTLTITQQAAVLSGDKRDGHEPTTVVFSQPLNMTRQAVTEVAEGFFARMAAALPKTVKPWMIEVTVVCLVKLEFGFQRHGLKVLFEEPKVVPNPKAEARVNRQAVLELTGVN